VNWKKIQRAHQKNFRSLVLRSSLHHDWSDSGMQEDVEKQHSQLHQVGVSALRKVGRIHFTGKLWMLYYIPINRHILFSAIIREIDYGGLSLLSSYQSQLASLTYIAFEILVIFKLLIIFNRLFTDTSHGYRIDVSQPDMTAGSTVMPTRWL
jgi:hypothetical protein